MKTDEKNHFWENNIIVIEENDNKLKLLNCLVLNSFKTGSGKGDEDDLRS